MSDIFIEALRSCRNAKNRDPRADLEQYREIAYRQLAELAKEYRKRAQPILNQLVEIERMEGRPAHFRVDDPSIAGEIIEIKEG